MRNSFSAGQSIQAVSVSSTKLFGAIACGSYVQVLKIDGDEVLSQCNLDSNSSGNSTFTTTDVAWNFHHAERLAASTTNGCVVVFHVDCSSSGSANKSSRRLESLDEASRAVHKVSWHPQEPDILASACQDGTVKIFDMRQPAQAQTLSSRADATRDVQFDPFHSHVLGAVYENGSLCLWDRRKPLSEDKVQTTWLKLAAHTNSSLAIAWCPNREWVLATGSRCPRYFLHYFLFLFT
jgi:WD repeat-containing protein 24